MKEINTIFKPSNIICIAFSFITLLFFNLLKCIVYIYFVGFPKGNTAFCVFNRCKCYTISVPVYSIDTSCTRFAFPAKLFCFLKAGELQPVNYPLVHTFHSICKFDNNSIANLFPLFASCRNFSKVVHFLPPFTPIFRHREINVLCKISSFL